jgi:metacaspase-1
MSGYSLHIGLNHVDADQYGGWDGELSGCLKDVASMKALAEAQGYEATTLTDGGATTQSVLAEIGRLAGQSQDGDIVLISYSGHGGQVPDVNSDEPEDDMDETWVLYDRQLVDDELYAAWSQFKPGVRVLVVSDSCHSGSVVRDLPVWATVRGAAPAEVPRLMPADIRRADVAARRETYVIAQQRAGRKEESGVDASVLLLPGCKDDQTSMDGPVNGAFTGGLLQVWNEGAFEGDYRSFIQGIDDELPESQEPVLFDRLVKDDAYTAQRPFTI